MGGILEFAARAVVIGVGATVVMDLWALFLRSAFGVRSLDYAWVGRWIGHFPRGRFAHAAIGKAEPVAGERVLGWTAHYAIGIAFAALLLALAGPGWASQPTPLPAIGVGLATIVVPWFVMQPAFGMGVAAAKAPSPGTARLRSVMTHLSFGVGLYLAALLPAALLPAG